MQRYTTRAIILTRTNFGEADRIITFLTPDHGKIKAIAKGVRKSRSKLAGALEIFSVSHIMILPGKNDISTVMSAKLDRYYANIVKDLDRTGFAYELMSVINKATEEQPEIAYFNLLNESLKALDNLEISQKLTRLWFQMQLLKLSGHKPNLRSDVSGNKLETAKTYNFNFESMSFETVPKGKIKAATIKFLRLGFGNNSPSALNRIENLEALIKTSQPLVQTMLQAHIRL